MARKTPQQQWIEKGACEGGLENGKTAVDLMVEGHLGLPYAGPTFVARARSKQLPELVGEVMTHTEPYFNVWSPAQLLFDEIDAAPNPKAAQNRYWRCFRKAAETRLRERGFIRSGSRGLSGCGCAGHRK